MTKYFAFLLFIFSVPAGAIEIVNFKSGLACTDGETFGWVCHETDKVYVTGQGKCTYNGEARACTWHGYEFDYKGITDETVIECKLTASYPFNFGNPNEETDINTTSTTYVLPVPVGDGHFFNPQYVALVAPEKPPYVRDETTECYAGETKLFEFNKQYVYPKNP
jgi:hypothetical protein